MWRKDPALSLPMGAAEFDRYMAGFEEFLDARRPVIERAGEMVR